MLARFFAAVTFTILIAPSSLAADWDHVHLVAPDTAAAAKWYADQFDGEVIKSGPFDAVQFGRDLVKFRQGVGETKPSAGAVIDHIGFAVKDVPAVLQALTAAGAKSLGEPRRVDAGNFTVAFVEDPWGTKIELIDDADTPGFHHVHVMSADPQKTVEWYAQMFGGTVEHFKGIDRIPGIKYNDMWLLVGTARADLIPSEGSSIDHLGWSPSDFAIQAEQLQKADTKFLIGPQKSGDHMMAFILDPIGTKIEVVGKPE